MYRGLRVAVVMPAFEEAAAIAGAIASVPEFVDALYVIDDASRDETARRALSSRRSVELIRHRRNRGVGAAIVTGYRRALAGGADVVAVMAGDGQMDPRDLPGLLDPIALGRADYAKGNRFLAPGVWSEMPPSRLAGNILLSLATKVASGYWRIFDSQCGYTAATAKALRAIDLDRVFPRYGYPNDVLARLHAAGMRVVDVPVRAVYGPGWKSGIRAPEAVVPLAALLCGAYFERLRAELAPARSPSLPPLGARPAR